MIVTQNIKIESIKVAFDPRCIAVIGASDSARKISGTIIPNLIKGGFEGIVYPINPKRTEIKGLKCYPSLNDVPEPVDLACITIPSHLVSKAINECVKKRVKSVVVISAGFGEIGAQGNEVQEEIAETARKAGVRIVAGPNCEGLISLVDHVWANIFSTPVTPVRGEIGFVSQSGGVQEAVLNSLWSRGVGISHCASVGNEADLGVQDYVDYLTQDENCKVITLFIEGVRKGQQFIKAAKMARYAKKPIVAMKVGRSERGRSVAMSHTGALVGADHLYDALFKQLNIIRAHNLEELVDTSMMLAWQPLPKGGNVGVITDSGGLSCIIADAVSETKLLALPDFANQTLKMLRNILPSVATARNPLDFTTAVVPEEYPEKLSECIHITAMDPLVDIVFVVATYWPLPIIPLLAEGIVKAARSIKQFGKPFLTCWPWITISDFSQIVKLLSEEKIPLFFDPENAVRTLDKVVQYKVRANKYDASKPKV